MRVLPPIPVTDGTFTSSTIAEPDAGETVWTAGTYATGVKRINTTTHRVYEVVADPSTHIDPVVGVATTPPTWVDIGPTNKWAMFDDVIGTVSTDNLSLSVDLDPDKVVNGVAGFNINGATSINVTMTDPSAGVVYNNDLSMLDNSSVVDYYEYFFEPRINITSFVLLDLPSYINASTSFTVVGAGDVSVGTFVYGNQISLGVTNHGTGLQLLDFNIKERDAFGNFKVTTNRRTAKLVDYDVTIPTARIGYVYNTLSNLTTKAAVWVGTIETDDSTLVYGYYRNMNINIGAPTISSATINIEGLV
jgi:hypothetical protein